MKHLLILGAQGQVGRALATEAHDRGIPHAALGHAQCDITDRAAVACAVTGSRLVVNCAAYTAVDEAEAHEEAAYRVNATGVVNVAAACAGAGIPLIHLSTDYVFDGESPRPYREDDTPRPLNAYGRTKLAGEEEVRRYLPAHIILRTSWIFSAHGQNFVRTILRLARTRRELRVVNDQFGGPTAAADIAKAILDISTAVERPGFGGWGTYHFAGAPSVSWYEFACSILGAGGPKVLPVSTKQFPRAARRPRNSVLDCSRLEQAFGITQPDWRMDLAATRDALALEHIPATTNIFMMS